MRSETNTQYPQCESCREKVTCSEICYSYLYYCRCSLGCLQVLCRVSKPHVRLDKRRRLPFVIVSSLTSAASCCSLIICQIRHPDTYIFPSVQRRAWHCLDIPQYVNHGWTRVSKKSGYSGPAQPGLSISLQVYPDQAL